MRSKRRYKICICSVILGQLETFRNYKDFPDSSLHHIFASESFRFAFILGKMILPGGRGGGGGRG